MRDYYQDCYQEEMARTDYYIQQLTRTAYWLERLLEQPDNPHVRSMATGVVAEANRACPQGDL